MLIRLFAVLVVSAMGLATQSAAQADAGATNEAAHGTLTYTGSGVTCAKVEAAMRKLEPKLKPLPCHDVPATGPKKSNQDTKPNNLGH